MTIRLEEVVQAVTTGRHRRRTHWLVRAIGICGRVFVAAGVALLLFTAYLLWGTGVYTKQAQQEAARAVAAKPIVSEEHLSTGAIPAARPQHPLKKGDPLFTIKIPKIGLENVVVQGVDQDSLRKGIGHFPQCREKRDADDCLDDTRYPGERGNVALSGHRTTYGAPFFRANELAKGDMIDIVSGRARYRYRVRGQEVVDPIAGFSTVGQHGRDELTLTTCHPRFSAAERLIIHADYVGASLISAGPSTTPSSPAATSDPQPLVPRDVAILAGISLASALGSLALSRRYRGVAGRLAIGLGTAAAMWIGLFPRVLALLPTNY